MSESSLLKESTPLIVTLICLTASFPSSFREEQPEVPAVTEKPEISGIQGMEPGTGETSGRAYCVVIFLLAGAAYVLIGKRLKEKG